MAISVTKKKSKVSKKEDPKKCCSSFTILVRFLYRIPIALSFLFLIYLWSSSTTIISGKILHVCVSSRKLNSLYCLSAGTQPKFEIPIPIVENSTIVEIPTPIVSNIAITSPASNVEVKKQVPTPVVSNSSIANVEMKKENILEFVRDGSDPTVRDSISHGRENEIAGAVKFVEEHLQVLRSWTSDRNRKGCDGRGIYVYDLPSKFNKDLVGQCRDMVPWMDFCKYFGNEGLGEPIPKLGKAWYRTHQYSLEPIFHSRVLKHPCRVQNENEAKLFYVPFYGGLDILRWHFKNVSNDVKDTLGLELVKWLERQRPWAPNSGKDHVFVLGKVSWDFRRKEKSWGTRFLELEQMQNPVKLLIERQPWHENDIGIPHPTYFHPHSDEDIMSWQSKIITSSRKHLVSFAGAARPDAPENIRSILIKQCTSVEIQKCQILDCSPRGCSQPESVIELFMESEFCLQPPGDSPTRKSVFDSLVSGCIPVLFDPFTAYYQYPWHLPEDHGKYSVFIDQKEVREKGVNVVEKLMKITKKERDDMRRFIVYELLPGLVYGDTDSQLERFQDAFSITISNLLERVNRLEDS
ncbi:xyloglucan-specific galacturonosyltransferase 1 [Morus notabilis]|uniref:xyloglucan-specific galacturonosyltransferase 1 n=1 Tax=Morus notabilis TaxID=981085 RepID=UPI000CECFEFD|nr:xyloglucan-specific galacturonosyltransferase 1 [Morus notabilis]